MVYEIYLRKDILNTHLYIKKDIDASNAENRKVVFMLDYWAQNLSVILGAALGAWLFRPAFEALLVILLLT